MPDVSDGLCRRCLLADDEERRPLYDLIREYVALIEPQARADAETYGRRLDACRMCPHLRRGGLCALCGCYVEARAAQKRSRCPDTPGRWG